MCEFSVSTAIRIPRYADDTNCCGLRIHPRSSLARPRGFITPFLSPRARLLTARNCIDRKHNGQSSLHRRAGWPRLWGGWLADDPVDARSSSR